MYRRRRCGVKARPGCRGAHIRGTSAHGWACLLRVASGRCGTFARPGPLGVDVTVAEAGTQGLGDHLGLHRVPVPLGGWRTRAQPQQHTVGQPHWHVRHRCRAKLQIARQRARTVGLQAQRVPLRFIHTRRQRPPPRRGVGLHRYAIGCAENAQRGQRGIKPETVHRWCTLGAWTAPALGAAGHPHNTLKPRPQTHRQRSPGLG